MNEQKKTCYEQVASCIRDRKTLKVIGEPSEPVKFSGDTNQPLKFVRESLKTAGCAPFHYDRNLNELAEPWRVHVIEHELCREIARDMRDWFSDMKPTNKLPAMLAACGALALITWIPQTADEIVDNDKRCDVNEEHLAATAAMVQNFLLLLTAAGYGSYWSSGGQFRTVEMFRRLGIEPGEKLLAAVFIEFPESQSTDLDRLPGKNREKRSASTKWMRTVAKLS